MNTQLKIQKQKDALRRITPRGIGLGKMVTFINRHLKGITRNYVDYSLEITIDGIHNDFPQYLIRTVADSPHTSTAIGKKAAFFRGRNISFSDIILNEAGLTLGQLHEKICTDFAMLERLAIWINVSNGGQILEIDHRPVECMRYAIPDFTPGENRNNTDYVVYNPYIGTSEYRKSNNKYYKIYEGTERLSQDVLELAENYQGHCFYYNVERPGSRVYSRPRFFSAEPYIHADAKAGEYHWRNAENNFFIGGIINKHLNPDEPIKDWETGEIIEYAGDKYERELHEALGGTENAGGFLINYLRSAEEIPASIIPFQAGNVHEIFDRTNTISRQVISTVCDIPLILMSVSTAGKLGESNEIKNAIAFVNQQTNSERMFLQNLYTKLLRDAGKISNSDEIIIDPIRSFTDIPDSVFSSLPEYTRKQYIEEHYHIEYAEQDTINDRSGVERMGGIEPERSRSENNA